MPSIELIRNYNIRNSKITKETGNPVRTNLGISNEFLIIIKSIDRISRGT